ncbi:MAG TPA: tetratricopeptide repeat protein [Cyclobacteriaceae bacterium]|nr:tetratricopeptide repeat protein [Cyclobacteriaceae bacterium]
MPSLISGYEYDIFISYRQKDNKGDHWVTAFVEALRTELESAFKDDVSIYFDANGADSLLETHNVDKSLEGKLKCLIFIPIISQTYCDPKSFAWKHEFCAFTALAKQDQFGIDVRLLNGNVASRILPIKIHELDNDDKSLIEKEMNGALRAVDFIYEAAGVLRPLMPHETDPKSNLRHIYYRDQINKVVRGVKDLMAAMRSPIESLPLTAQPATSRPSVRNRKALALAAAFVFAFTIGAGMYFFSSGGGEPKERDRSIAVLPFENMNRDSTQDYFTDGIAEDILNHLAKIADLRVKSRTSTLQYKGTKKTIAEIGDELAVANVVEGSIRRVGGQVRIVVQLIDTQTDTHLWSETYDRELKDVLTLQSEIAIEIAKALEAKLTSEEKKSIVKGASANAEAYDYYLKARAYQGRGSFRRVEIDNAMELVKGAITRDNKFSRAYALKGVLWLELSTFGLPQRVWLDSAMSNADLAIATDPASPEGYVLKSRLYRYMGQIDKGDSELEKAYAAAPNDPGILDPYGYMLLRRGDEKGAELVLRAAQRQYSPKDPEYYQSFANAYYYTQDLDAVVQYLRRSSELNPDAVDPYLGIADVYFRRGDYDQALAAFNRIEKINPNLTFVTDRMAWCYFKKGDYPNAARLWQRYSDFESALADSTQSVPFRHRLAMTYLKMGRAKEARKLLLEDLRIQTELRDGKRGYGVWAGMGANYYDIAVDRALLGKTDEAIQALDSAFNVYQFYYFDGYGRDPAFEQLRRRDDFLKVAASVDSFYARRQKAFTKALDKAGMRGDLKSLFDK